MSQRASMIFALLALATLLAAVAAHQASEATADSPSPRSRPADPAASPVVVELFTSQGCSSCPPADRLLSHLGREGLGGIEVIPLSFHVDYWNYIGWRDPFSHARWSRRQEEYAKSLAKGRLYTPQAVVQGMEDCVGSRSGCLEKAIARAARRAPGAELTAQHRLKAGGSINLQATVRPRPGSPSQSSGAELEAVAVVFERGLETAVSRGENARRKLENDYVVRRLEPIFTLSKPQVREGETSSGTVLLHLDPDWDRDRLGVAVLVQETRSRHVVAAWARDLLP